ncbi:MAG: (deoxy)nucleoside triphosphate pyrophosphohydrolase [Novosphingobium sp.]
MENYSTVRIVVAAAMLSDDGTVLMQQRPPDKAYGGLWEFPGGKMERGETPQVALVREIDEELGLMLDPADLFPITFACEPSSPGRTPILLLLFGVRRWVGVARAIEPGSHVRWVPAEGLSALAMPPLDIPLSQAVIRLLEGVAKANGHP